MPSNHIVENAEDDRREKWIDKNFPDGTTIDHACCSDCSTWVVGKPRCSCGNRRMSLTVEKGVDGKYFAYGEAD